MSTLAETSHDILENCNMISQFAPSTGTVAEINLLRCALHMSFEAARLLRVTNGDYRTPLRPLQKSLAALTLIHADMSSVANAHAVDARERLRQHIAHLQEYVDRLAELGDVLAVDLLL